MRRTLIAFGLTAPLVFNAPFSVFDSLWELLSTVWSNPPSVQQQPTKEGCGADPFGRCNSASPPPTDEGCGMDPFGLCSSGS